MHAEAIGKSKAAVPIPIYRELAAELQAAHTKIAQLQNHNERLLRQNRVLNEEVEALLSAHQHVHATFTEATQRIAAVMAPPVVPSTEKSEIVIAETDIPVQIPQVAQPVAPLLGVSDQGPTLNRGWLTAMIALIVLISFGAGYILILSRPQR